MSSKSGKLTTKQVKALSERLLLEPKSVWDQADASQRREIFTLAERYKTFLDQAKTERLAVETIRLIGSHIDAPRLDLKMQPLGRAAGGSTDAGRRREGRLPVGEPGALRRRQRRVRGLASGGAVLVLVKPQFEAGREHVGAGGVVRDEAARQAAVDKVAACLAGLGLGVLGQCQSLIQGPAGNVEFFLLARKPAAGTAS